MKIRLKNQNIVIFQYNSKGEINPLTEGAKQICAKILTDQGRDVLAQKMEDLIKPHYKGKGVGFFLFRGQAYYEWDQLAKKLVKENKAVEVL